MQPDDALLIGQSIPSAIDRLQRIIVVFRGEIFEEAIWKFEQFVRPTKGGQKLKFYNELKTLIFALKLIPRNSSILKCVR
jgi:hypothetical protein